MKSRSFSASFNLLAKSINQVIYFLTNCFTFLTKFWMLQVRKSRFCGISVIFIQCCFMSETQVLMTVLDFSGFFSWNHFPEGSFHWGRGFQLGAFIFKWGERAWGALALMGMGFKTNLGCVFHLFLIPQRKVRKRNSKKKSQTFTMCNVRIKTNNVNSTQNCSCGNFPKA